MDIESHMEEWELTNLAFLKDVKELIVGLGGNITPMVYIEQSEYIQGIIGKVWDSVSGNRELMIKESIRFISIESIFNPLGLDENTIKAIIEMYIVRLDDVSDVYGGIPDSNEIEYMVHQLLDSNCIVSTDIIEFSHTSKAINTVREVIANYLSLLESGGYDDRQYLFIGWGVNHSMCVIEYMGYSADTYRRVLDVTSDDVSKAISE